MDCIALGDPAAVYLINDKVIRKLIGELAYMIIFDPEHDYNEELNVVNTLAGEFD